MSKYKYDYSKILTRLRIILSRLNDGEALSVNKLAKEFKRSTRTIQRDFKERLAPLFPIYQENKKWVMDKGYRIEKTRSVEDEIILGIIEKLTEGIGGDFAVKAKSLLSKLKNKIHNPIYAKLNIEDISDKIDEIQIIEKAIKSKNMIQFNYKDDNSIYHNLIRKPLKLVNFEGFWYLIALHDDILKKYYLKNIRDCKILDETFEIDTKIDSLLSNSLSIWFRQDVEPFEVKLYATNVATKYFKRRPLPTQYIEKEYGDGSMEFSIKITDKMEILPIVKYWLPHLYIIEPKEIKDSLEKDIKLFLEQSNLID